MMGYLVKLFTMGLQRERPCLMEVHMQVNWKWYLVPKRCRAGIFLFHCVKHGNSGYVNWWHPDLEEYSRNAVQKEIFYVKH